MLPFRAAQIIQYIYNNPSIAVEELIKECEKGTCKVRVPIKFPSCFCKLIDENSIKFVKHVRTITGWGLKEANDVRVNKEFTGSI